MADVTFDSCLSRFDTYLRVISLSDGGWRQVAACDDCGDCASANRAKLSTGPLAAGDYLLLVEGWARAEGRYVVSVECATLGTLVANLGYDKLVMPKPVFIGDTLRAETEVVELRDSKSRPEAGLVTFRHILLNQRDEPVCQCLRTALLKRKGA